MMKELMEALEAAIEGKSESVGILPMDQVALFEAVDKRYEDLKEERKTKVMAYMEQITEEMKPIAEEIQAASDALWNNLYERFGIAEENRDGNYKLNPETGELRRVIKPGLAD
jgi:hypothetical protein